MIHLIFGKFEELGSANAVLRFLQKESLRIGVRQAQGAASGQLHGKCPTEARSPESCTTQSTREPMSSGVIERM